MSKFMKLGKTSHVSLTPFIRLRLIRLVEYTVTQNSMAVRRMTSGADGAGTGKRLNRDGGRMEKISSHGGKSLGEKEWNVHLTVFRKLIDRLSKLFKFMIQKPYRNLLKSKRA